jgi:hypothetical protein
MTLTPENFYTERLNLSPLGSPVNIRRFSSTDQHIKTGKMVPRKENSSSDFYLKVVSSFMKKGIDQTGSPVNH